MKSRGRVAALLVTAMLVPAGTVFAHEHNVAGTVTQAATDHLTIRTTAGKTATVKITKDTKFTSGKDEVKLASIKEGTRIVVTTESDVTPYAAKIIQVGATAPAQGKKK